MEEDDDDGERGGGAERDGEEVEDERQTTGTDVGGLLDGFHESDGR